MDLESLILSEFSEFLEFSEFFTFFDSSETFKTDELLFLSSLTFFHPVEIFLIQTLHISLSI
jgi:hypothetical protein